MGKSMLWAVLYSVKFTVVAILWGEVDVCTEDILLTRQLNIVKKKREKIASEMPVPRSLGKWHTTPGDIKRGEKCKG